MRTAEAYREGNQFALVSFGLTKLAWPKELLDQIRSHAQGRMAVRGDVSPELTAPAFAALRSRVLENVGTRLQLPSLGEVPLHVPLRIKHDVLGMGMGALRSSRLGPSVSFSTFYGPQMQPRAHGSIAVAPVEILRRGDSPFSRLTNETELAAAIKHLTSRDIHALDIADLQAHPVIRQNPELMAMGLAALNPASLSRGTHAAASAAPKPLPRGLVPSGGPKVVRPTPSAMLKKR